MGKNNSKGGGVDLLAKAMKRVFKEAVEEGVVPLRKDVGTLRDDVGTLRKDMERGLKTTDQNVQKQLSQHRKNVASDFKKALGKG